MPEYKKAKDELKEMTTTLEQRKSEVLALSNDKTATIKKKESLDLKDETKTVKYLVAKPLVLVSCDMNL